MHPANCGCRSCHSPVIEFPYPTHAPDVDYERGAADALRAVMRAFGEGVSPSYVVAHVAEQMGVEL